MHDVRLIDRAAAEALGPWRQDELRIERVAELGALMDASYALLESQFDPAVLDPMETYVDLLTKPTGDGMLPILLAAVFERGETVWVADFFSGDVMTVIGEPSTAILAVGNIATAQGLKDVGVRGIGSRLFDAAAEVGREKAAAKSVRLRYALAEAEEASLGFWHKRGYRWPSGVNYLQPPLEFDDDGRPVHGEVPETLMLCPLEGFEEDVDTSLLRKIIRTVYENWCLRGYRGELSPGAMAAAEEYVMQRVFDQVDATLAESGPIPLVAKAS